MKWLPAYPRRLVRKMIRENREEHKGYRYKIKIDKKTKERILNFYKIHNSELKNAKYIRSKLKKFINNLVEK